MTYPEHCRENIRRVTEATGANPEAAYAMLLMAALLMDLRPEDEDAANIVLKDFRAGVTA